MREIKFRAWGKDYAHEEFSMCRPFDFREYVTFNEMAQERLYPFTGNKTVFMQYTGLKDKNGVEIYEGDIVETENNLNSGFSIDSNHIGVIAYQRAEYIVKAGVVGTSLSVLTGAKWKIEVIGNIYENPELLAPITNPITKERES